MDAETREVVKLLARAYFSPPELSEEEESKLRAFAEGKEAKPLPTVEEIAERVRNALIAAYFGSSVVNQVTPVVSRVIRQMMEERG